MQRYTSIPLLTSALFTCCFAPVKEPHFQLQRRLREPPGQYERACKKRKALVPTEVRTTDRSTRSECPYRLRNAGPFSLEEQLLSERAEIRFQFIACK